MAKPVKTLEELTVPFGQGRVSVVGMDEAGLANFLADRVITSRARPSGHHYGVELQIGVFASQRTTPPTRVTFGNEYSVKGEGDARYVVCPHTGSFVRCPEPKLEIYARNFHVGLFEPARQYAGALLLRIFQLDPAKFEGPMGLFDCYNALDEPEPLDALINGVADIHLGNLHYTFMLSNKEYLST